MDKVRVEVIRVRFRVSKVRVRFRSRVSRSRVSRVVISRVRLELVGSGLVDLWNSGPQSVTQQWMKKR